MSSEPLSVALLHPSFRPGSGRVVDAIIQATGAELSARGHAVRVITSHRGRYQREVEDGLAVARHWRPPEPWTLRNIESGLSHLPFAYASLAADPPDVAHALNATDARAARRWSLRGGGPTVFTCVGVPTRQAVAAVRLRKAILERAIAESDALTVTSRRARDAVWRWFGREAAVVYPGVQAAHGEPSATRAEEPTVACVADDRGRQVLTHAFGRVRRAVPGAKLVVVRHGEHAPGPLAAAHAVGVLGHDDSFALPLAAALSRGTPVFGSRAGTASEIVDGPAVGQLFDPSDEDGVAHAIVTALELAKDPGTSAACRTRAEAFDGAAGAAAYLSLYRRVQGG